MINEEIRDKEVRLIASSGEQLGIVSTKEALSKAYDDGMDLVMIAPNSKPPVCKIMDYSKYRFDQMKKEKEARKKQKVMEVKERVCLPTSAIMIFRSALKMPANGLRTETKLRSPSASADGRLPISLLVLMCLTSSRRASPKSA